jgi:hypothetical protein
MPKAFFTLTGESGPGEAIPRNVVTQTVSCGYHWRAGASEAEDLPPLVTAVTYIAARSTAISEGCEIEYTAWQPRRFHVMSRMPIPLSIPSVVSRVLPSMLLVTRSGLLPQACFPERRAAAA